MQEIKRQDFDSWVGKIPLEKDMVNHSSIFAWRIPWTGRASGLWSSPYGHKEAEMSEVNKIYNLPSNSLFPFIIQSINYFY